jgi:predicted ribosome quality control (RQC) complex YloA/Tae2 family protein
MFHNFFFLKRLAPRLEEILRKKQLIECFSQNKDELILGFASDQRQLFIKATLDSKIGLLHFSDDYKRARKNSIDLFPELINEFVSQVHCFQNERSFQIVFESGRALVFKMHGSRSNILLVKDDRVQEIFRHSLIADASIKPSQLNKPNLSFESFQQEDGDPKKALPALGKEVYQYLSDHGYNQKPLDQKWEMLNRTIERISTLPISLIIKENAPPQLSLLIDQNDEYYQTFDPVDGSNAFYEAFTKYTYLHEKKSELLKPLDKQIRQSRNYLSKTRNKLDGVKNQRSYEEIANIVMANLHVLKSDGRQVEVVDFYSGKPISLEIKPNISPQKHAENLYRKAKNQKIELSKLEQNIAAKEQLLQELLAQRDEIEAIEDFRHLKTFRSDQNPPATPSRNLPYHLYHVENYQVLVGKNSKSNDELTTKIAHKNDCWLHAKDVPGSHVIIKNSDGKAIPSNILEQAAQLAAWFSKRKTDSLCPVIYTEKKYVRKIKGSPAGSVKVDREKVLMVTPKNIQTAE